MAVPVGSAVAAVAPEAVVAAAVVAVVAVAAAAAADAVADAAARAAAAAAASASTEAAPSCAIWPGGFETKPEPKPKSGRILRAPFKPAAIPTRQKTDSNAKANGWANRSEGKGGVGGKGKGRGNI